MQRVLTNREKSIFYLASGIIIFAFVFNIFIAPLLDKNYSLSKEVSALRNKLKKYHWLLGQRENLQAKYSNFSSVVKLSGQGRQDSLVSALSELEALAESANIKIIDVRPQSGSKNLGVYKESLIDLRTEGSMEGYLKFIYNLENSLSLLKIKRAQLSAKPNSSLLEGSFTLSRLSLPQK